MFRILENKILRRMMGSVAKIKNERAQATMIEYAIFIACFILALIAMQSYLKRGIEGGLRSSADSLGSQYDPTKTSSDFTITSSSNIFTDATVRRVGDVLMTNTTVTTNFDDQTRTGTETVGAY